MKGGKVINIQHADTVKGGKVINIQHAEFEKWHWIVNESETTSLIATSFQQAFVPPYSATPGQPYVFHHHPWIISFATQQRKVPAVGSRTVPVFRGAFSCESQAPEIETQQIRILSVNNRASTPCPEASQVHVPHQRIHGRLGPSGKGWWIWWKSWSYCPYYTGWWIVFLSCVILWYNNPLVYTSIIIIHQASVNRQSTTEP